MQRRRSPRRRTEAGMLFVGAVVVLFATLLESLALTGKLPAHIVEFIVFLALIGLGVQLVNRIYAPNADPVIMPVVLVLNGMGYVFIERGDPGQAGQQLAWTVIGLVHLRGRARNVVGYSRDLDRYRYLILAAAFLLLISPLLPGIGEKINGARLWVHASSFEFQPVEIAKLLLVIFFASYFVDKRELLTVPTRRIGNRMIPDLRAFGPIAAAAIMALLIILVEDDIGFSLILFLVFLTMIWAATGRWTYIVIGLAGFALVAFLASHILTQVNERFTDWLNPWPYPTGIGLQPIQGELAFGRGGLFGTGIGFGLAQGVLPISSSDYIFAIIGEEMGLVGALAIVACFAIFVGAGIAGRAARAFGVLPAVRDGTYRHPRAAGVPHHGGRHAAVALDGGHAPLRLLRGLIARRELRLGGDLDADLQRGESAARVVFDAGRLEDRRRSDDRSRRPLTQRHRDRIRRPTGDRLLAGVAAAHDDLPVERAALDGGDAPNGDRCVERRQRVGEELVRERLRRRNIVQRVRDRDSLSGADRDFERALRWVNRPQHEHRIRVRKPNDDVDDFDGDEPPRSRRARARSAASPAATASTGSMGSDSSLLVFAGARFLAGARVGVAAASSLIGLAIDASRYSRRVRSRRRRRPMRNRRRR